MVNRHTLLHTAVPPTKGELAKRIAEAERHRQAMGKAMQDQGVALTQTRQMLMALVYRYGVNASLDVTWADLRAQIGQTLRIQDSEGGIRFSIVPPEPTAVVEAEIPFNDPPEAEAA